MNIYSICKEWSQHTQNENGSEHFSYERKDRPSKSDEIKVSEVGEKYKSKRITFSNIFAPFTDRRARD